MLAVVVVAVGAGLGAGGGAETDDACLDVSWLDKLVGSGEEEDVSSTAVGTALVGRLPTVDPDVSSGAEDDEAPLFCHCSLANNPPCGFAVGPVKF